MNLCFITHVEAEILWIACIELALEGDIVICHPQQLAVLQSVLIDVRAVARRVRVLLIELSKSAIIITAATLSSAITTRHPCIHQPPHKTERSQHPRQSHVEESIYNVHPHSAALVNYW